MSTNREKAGWLAGLLTGWGVKESWAKVIAGALIGALCAAGVLALDACSASLSLRPDGVWNYRATLALPVDCSGK